MEICQIEYPQVIRTCYLVARLASENVYECRSLTKLELKGGGKAQVRSSMSGATPAFSISKGVHCISVYAVGSPSGHHLCKHWWQAAVDC